MSLREHEQSRGTAIPPQPFTSAVTSNPWNALWAMMIGFFMILVDSTIVAVANPNIMEKLATDYDTVLWVTSAYLLASAVPLLLAGRLGDQYGPKNLYIIGLFIFTAASLWCALAPSIGVLVAARVLQGIGAALLTPQTLSTITRIFPPERRGVAMSVWGATAGVATLVGPLAGGVLVDHLGWQWIFFVNVPIGVIGLGLAVWLIPTLPTKTQRFDVLGVVLSGAAMFLVVFGLQEGEDHNWSTWIWATVGGGVVLMVAFVYWQSINKNDPLVPLHIFRDRNFSLSNLGVAVIGFAVTSMVVPAMFYAQMVCGLTPTRSALLTAPMAVATGVLAPVVGRIVDRAHPRPIVGFGFSVLAISLTWLAWEMTPTTPIWRVVLPFAGMGIGMAFIWAPLAATATRNLSPELAGAGSGVYNAMRQVGSVLGSAGIAAFMSSRISDQMPGGGQASQADAAVGQLPEFLRAPFATALSQSMLLPAFVALFGVIAALFLVGFARQASAPRVTPKRALPVGAGAQLDPFPGADARERADWRNTFSHAEFQQSRNIAPSSPDGYVRDDDDSYVEFAVEREPEHAPEPDPAGWAEPTAIDEGHTEPLATRVELPLPAPADTWHSAPVESWHSLLAEPIVDEPGTEPIPEPIAEPVSFAHNGFHSDELELLLPPAPVPVPVAVEVPAAPVPAVDVPAVASPALDVPAERPSRHQLPDGPYGGPPPSRHRLADVTTPPPTGRHSRADVVDGAGGGRHSRARET